MVQPHALVSAAFAQLARMPRNHAFRWLLLPMLVIAAGLVALHISMAYLIADSGFTFWHKASLERDRGYAERYEYALMSLTIAALLVEYWRRRAPVHLAIATIIGVLIWDNMWLWHERAGTTLLKLGVVSWEDWGQLIYYLLFGMVAGSATALALRFSKPDDGARAVAVLLMILPIAAFGIAVDLIHAALKAEPMLNELFLIVEEAGEMAMICIMTAVAATLALDDREVAILTPGALCAAEGEPAVPDRSVGIV